MKLFISINLLLGVLLISGFLSGKKITATLTKINKKENKTDTVKIFTTLYNPDETIDLLFCIKNFNYPPSLPKNLILQIPPSPLGSFNQKSIYDERGRLIKYYYRGSMVSGILPYGYDFIYQNDSSFTLKYLKDEADESIYDFCYNEKENIQKIELSDTSGIIERLSIQ